MTDLGALGEFGLIKKLVAGLHRSEGVLQGPGDDCAVVQLGTTRVLLSCDAMVEGVHFRREWAPPGSIGWKAVAAALSDIAAMGGTARYILITLGCPADTDTAYLSQLYSGIAEISEHYNVAVVGGDTVRAGTELFLDITVVGELEAGVEPRCRNGAQPGDVVAVTGYPGSSGLGLAALERGDAPAALLEAHTRPRPRLAEGAWLARESAVHAMIDISDGIASDLGHIADCSGVCISLKKENLPISKEMQTYAQSIGVSPEDYALSGGEDYELAVTISLEAAADLSKRFSEKFTVPLTCIGTVTAGTACVLVAGHPISCAGYDHFAAEK